MKMRDVAFMAAGAGMMCAYDKYNKPMKKMMKKKLDKTADSLSKLEEIM